MADSGRAEMERVIADKFGVTRVVSVSRAALGLNAVLQCWKAARGELRVALSPAVCHDVVVAVRAAGATLVFCDVDATTGLVPRSEWVRARALGATVAIVVHLYGNPADVAEVQSIFSGAECLVIDDAAQALGSQNSTGLAGGSGDVGLLSFGPTKQIEAGGAAILFCDSSLANEVEQFLNRVEPVSELETSVLHRQFRTALEHARMQLRLHGRSAAADFSGLLDGLEPTLRKAWPAGCDVAVMHEMRSYPQAMADRGAKADAWRTGLRKTGFVPVGMGAHAVPWRFSCRLPGIDWAEQHRLAEAMRARGVDVSHWYLPAHWMHSSEAGHLPGVETLSREVFQFWVDANTKIDVIRAQVAIVASIIATDMTNASA